MDKLNRWWLKPGDFMLCLNIGSGQRPFRDDKGYRWVNVDNQKRWKPELLCDAGDLRQHFLPGSVDLIVIHHCLEHFGCGEGDKMLRVCKEILKSGSSILIFVPDMFMLARMWFAGDISTQVYMTNVYGAYMGDEADRHKWGYDPTSLLNTLHDLGYKHGQRFNWRPLPGANIARDKWILGVEAFA